MTLSEKREDAHGNLEQPCHGEDDLHPPDRGENRNDSPRPPRRGLVGNLLDEVAEDHEWHPPREQRHWSYCDDWRNTSDEHEQVLPHILPQTISVSKSV